jgi:hypothetical protein
LFDYDIDDIILHVEYIIIEVCIVGEDKTIVIEHGEIIVLDIVLVVIHINQVIDMFLLFVILHNLLDLQFDLVELHELDDEI